MKNKLVWFLFAVSIFTTCTINDKDFQIKSVESNPTLVAPLASGSLSISDLLTKQDSSNVKVKSDGLVYLSYDQSLVSSDIRNLIKIPDVGNLTTLLAVPPGAYPANQNDFNSTTFSQPVDMGISPEQLTEIGFKSGTLTYKMNLTPANNNFKYAVVIAIPEFKSNTSGTSFSQEVSGTGSLSLSGYTYKGTTANKLTLQVTLVIKKNSASTVVAPGSNLNVTISFAGLDFTYIKGFFGDQIATPPPQSINVQAFGTSFQNGASVSFAQPTIDLTVISDYGVPLKVTFLKLEARKQNSALTIQTNPASPVPITAPATLGTSASTNVSITNVNQVVDFAPTQFYYQVSGHINSGLTSGSNFMADTSKMRVKLHVELPLFGKASSIVTADTIDIDLSGVDQSKIDSASLKTSITNELPLDANIQFILTDSKFKFIDSLLTAAQTGIVKGSSVDSSGELQAAGVVDKMIPLQQTKISKIFTAKKIIATAKLNTSKNLSGNQVDVKFKSQYKIKINLGLRATVKLNAGF